MEKPIFSQRAAINFSREIVFKKVDNTRAHDATLLTARVAIIGLLLLEQNPTQLGRVIDSLDALRRQGVSFLEFPSDSRGAKQTGVFLERIIADVQYAKDSDTDIRSLMTSLRTLFRL